MTRELLTHQNSKTMYYKIEFKTHSMFVYGAIAKIANKSNVVKRKITMSYDLVITHRKNTSMMIFLKPWRAMATPQPISL